MLKIFNNFFFISLFSFLSLSELFNPKGFRWSIEKQREGTDSKGRLVIYKETDQINKCFKHNENRFLAVRERSYKCGKR